MERVMINALISLLERVISEGGDIDRNWLEIQLNGIKELREL